MNNYRKEILLALIEYFEYGKRYFLLYGDMGFSGIDEFKLKYPTRILNFGIAEQAMVGVAAGMAMSGFIPIVYTMCNFLCYRALEQIRNDVVLQDLNVKFIGTGANDYFSFLGESHTCGTDDIAIFDTIGLDVNNPYRNGRHDEWYYDTESFKICVKQWLENKKASYIRV